MTSPAERARAYARTAERAFQRALAGAPASRSVVTASKRAEEARDAAHVLEEYASTLPPGEAERLYVQTKTAAAAAGRAAGRALGSWGALRKRALDRGDWAEYDRLEKER